MGIRMTPYQTASKYGACLEARTWIEKFNTIQEAWETCKDYCWLVWTLDRVMLPKKEMFEFYRKFFTELINDEEYEGLDGKRFNDLQQTIELISQERINEADELEIEPYDSEYHQLVMHDTKTYFLHSKQNEPNNKAIAMGSIFTNTIEWFLRISDMYSEDVEELLIRMIKKEYPVINV